MSNYCGTDYYFDGDKDCLMDLYSRMKRVAEDESIDDYRVRKSMRRVAEAFGLAPEDYFTCGFFEGLYLAKEGDSAGFFVESDNSPCEELIGALTALYERKIRVLWFVSCDDDGLYYTNDREGEVFRDRFEVYLEDIDDEWFESVPEAVAWIAEQTGITIPDDVSSNVDRLYEFITNDLECLLGYCCNFHSVIVR